MNIKTLSDKLSLGVGLGAVCLFGSESASAAASTLPNDFWFWLYNLPDVALIALVIALFAGLSWLGLELYRRLRRSGKSQPGRRSGYYAVFAGGVLGVLVAMLAAGPWKAFLYDKITVLPPTAVGPPPSAYPLANDLFTDPDPQFADRKPEMPPGALVSRANRTRHAGINFDALSADSLALNLFDDESLLIAVRTREVRDMQGGSVWVGQIEDHEGSEVILASKGRALAGTVSVDGRLFEIAYVNGNTHAVREIDVSQLPPDHPAGVKLATEGADTAAGTMAETMSTGASTGQVIDVLVLYTPNARNNAGGDNGIQSKILNAVTAANQAYLNSQIDINLNVVYMVPIDYVETNDMTMTWSRLLSASDGYMDGAHSLRDQYGADVIMLVSTDTNYCGYATIITTFSTSSAPYAFGVVRDSCLTAGSFAHEVGHIQGNVHNPENADFAGAYPDSYGYRICGKFRDIMSYSCSGEIRIAYFSNPSITYSGYPTGVAGANDTARSMNATAATVASFRGSATTPTVPAAPTVPTAPGNLAANAPTSDSVTLTWTDNAGDETGYKVQRSLDNANWSEIAALAQGTTSFSNTGLTGGQTYSYRVYAYNSIGNSAYSNTASATIAAPPAAAADTTQPVVKFGNPLSDAVVSGVTVSVSVSATDNVGLSGLKLYVNNKLVSATNAGSLIYNWNIKKLTAGSSYTLRADAIDTSGNLGSASVSVTKK